MQSAIGDMLSQIRSAEVVIVVLGQALPTTWGELHSALLWRMDCPNWLNLDSRMWTTTMPPYWIFCWLHIRNSNGSSSMLPWGLQTTTWYRVLCPLSSAVAEHPQLVTCGTTIQQIRMGCVHFTHLIPMDRFDFLLMILVPVPLLLPMWFSKAWNFIFLAL